MATPHLSVVIPVYNEEAGLPALFARLYPALDALGIALRGHLRQRRQPRPLGGAAARPVPSAGPTSTRVVLFNANYGQHTAIIAGFERVRGERVVTLDADLQNPPEEIGKLLAAMDAGHDYVGGVRRDARGRVVAAHRVARDEPAARAHHAHPDDRPGLHAARLQPRRSSTPSRRAARSARSSRRSPTRSRSNPTEVEVAHEERAAGESKYSLYKLIRLNFDLVTGFSLVPLQLFSLFGMLVVGGWRSSLTSSSSSTALSHVRLGRGALRCSGTATSSRSS